jgi:hypothetical protein
MSLEPCQLPGLLIRVIGALSLSRPSSVPALRLLIVTYQGQIDIERLEHHIHGKRLQRVSERPTQYYQG